MRVQVYRNLRTGTWSVRDKKTRRVIAHPRQIALHNCTFFVSPSGNARVRREECKNVHAWIEGEIGADPLYGVIAAVKYNPYKHRQFMANDKVIKSAAAVVMDVDSTFPVIAFLSIANGSTNATQRV